MRKRVGFAIIMFGVIAIVFTLEQFSPREPTYRGRRLRSWIQDGINGTHPNLSAAKEAVRAAGTNAIPFYLKLLQTKPHPGLKDKLLNILERWNWPHPGLRHQGFSDEITGFWGLLMLGPESGSAAPTLLKLIRDGDVTEAILAGAVLAQTGERAEEISILLNDPRTELRCRAADIAAEYAVENPASISPRSPAQIENSARILVPALISHLDDPNTSVRFATIYALGQFAREPESVVPILIGNLQTAGDARAGALRRASVLTLEKYGAGAKPAVPALQSIFKDTNGGVNLPAGRALMRIDDAAGGEVVKTFATLILDTKLDGDTQMDIISALGDYGGKAFAAEPVLIKLALLPNQRLRIPAAIALAEINPEAAIRAGVQLSDLFEPAKFRLEETEIAVIRAIGKTRKPSAEFLKCLRLAAKDKSPEISREADAALKRIASREATQAGGK